MSTVVVGVTSDAKVVMINQGYVEPTRLSETVAFQLSA